MSGAQLSWVSSVVRYKLTGPPGRDLDALVAGLISTGISVESIVIGEAYRLDGKADRLDAIAEQVNQIEGFTLGPEAAPVDVVRLTSTVRPPRAYRRQVTIHSAADDAFSHIARAVDAGLLVSPAGICMWTTTGPTARLLAWLSTEVHKLPVEDVLNGLGLTAEAAALEDLDVPSPPTVNVVLPPRRTTTQDIQRNSEGDITKIVQVETDAHE